MDRLQISLSFLRIPFHVAAEEMAERAEHLLKLNSLNDAVVRVSVSRGVGPRGYAPSGSEEPLLVITAEAPSAAPARLASIVTSSFRVPAGDRLPQHKTGSRLLNVLAAMEARDAGADDALLVDTEGHVTEGVSSNVFWIDRGTVCTAPTTIGLLPGITRQAILELCSSHGFPVDERTIAADDLPRTDGMFLTMTSRGVVEVGSMDGRTLQRSAVTQTLARALVALIAAECS
jgi:branched-chain amino acid aminotransferase